MLQIIENLKKFGFSKADSIVYVSLLKYPNLNGSQLAKKIELVKPSVYLSLDNLYKRGAVYLLPGENNKYKAKEPKTLLAELKTEYLKSMSDLDEEFEKYNHEEKDDEKYYNISGNENFIQKTKEMILRAEKEIYVNTNYDIMIFYKELKEVIKKGVRVMLFTFKKFNLKDLDIDYFYNSKLGDVDFEFKRMMLVIDSKEGLIFSGDKNVSNGVFTKNNLLISIVSEHIHHDIYIMKMEKELGSINKFLINSEQEKFFYDEYDKMKKEEEKKEKAKKTKMKKKE